MSVSNYNTDPDLNTTISGINIAEGCPPSGINNAIRQLMADVKSLDGDLVHTAGAESITGAKTFTAAIIANGAAVRNSGTDGMIVIRGGTGSTDGAYAVLYGKDALGTEGQFVLRAQDGANNTSLAGTPAGGLTWGGKAVELLDSISAANSGGYVRFKGGLQVCWGQTSALSGSTAVDFTDAGTKDFAHTPVVITGSNKNTNTWVTGPSTTGFTVACGSYSSSPSVRWIAIGDWA